MGVGDGPCECSLTASSSPFPPGTHVLSSVRREASVNRGQALVRPECPTLRSLPFSKHLPADVPCLLNAPSLPCSLLASSLLGYDLIQTTQLPKNQSGGGSVLAHLASATGHVVPRQVLLSQARLRPGHAPSMPGRHRGCLGGRKIGFPAY